MDHKPSRCSSSLFNESLNKKWIVDILYWTRLLHPDPSQFVADWSVGQQLPKRLFTFYSQKDQNVFLQKSCLNRLIHQLKSFPLWKMLNQLYQCINNDQPYESIAKMSQKPSKKAEPFFALSVFCLQRLRRKQPALFWHLQPLQPSRQIVESIEHEVLIWAVLGTGLPSRYEIT